jgi:hypothetical protein
MGKRKAAEAVATGVQSALRNIKDLNFLHNTSPEALARYESIGGMPMPSIAVTKQDVPFDGFGDITLVGKPESFNPRATKLNEVYSSDAFTVRAPSPVRVAKKGAGKRFQEADAQFVSDAGGYTSEIESNLWELERKGNVDPYPYDKVVRFFESDADGGLLFLRDKGIEIPRREDGKVDRSKLYEVLEPYRKERVAWAKDKIGEYFDGGDYFVTNPDRDRYAQRAKLQDYTADNVAKWMKRRSGTNQEGGMSSFGFGAMRASTAEPMTSLKQIRDKKGALMPKEQLEEIYEANQNKFTALADELKPYYKYQSDSFGYLDEVSDMVQIAQRKGLRGAMSEVGFEDVPEELVDQLNDFSRSLRESNVPYFESKPKRVVDLQEFGGAIVPEGTPQETIDLLESRGIRVEKYGDGESRQELRKKFPEYAFMTAGTALTLGAASQSEDADAALTQESNMNMETQDGPAWMQSAMQNIAPEEEAEIDRRITQRLRGAQYRKRSRQREDRYAGIRESLLSGVTAIDRTIGNAFQAIEMPYQGYLGLTRAAGGLMAGESPQQALMQGAQDARAAD